MRPNDLKMCKACGQAIIPRRCAGCDAQLRKDEQSPCINCKISGVIAEPLPFDEAS